MVIPDHHCDGDLMTNSNGGRNAKDAYKRWFDLSVLFLAHVLLLPLWIILWTGIPVLIWLGDRGPIFYRQQRMGKDGKPFGVVKFRLNCADNGFRNLILDGKYILKVPVVFFRP